MTPSPWTVNRSGVSVDAGPVRIRQERGADDATLRANAPRAGLRARRRRMTPSFLLERAAFVASFLERTGIVSRYVSVHEGGRIRVFVDLDELRRVFAGRSASVEENPYAVHYELLVDGVTVFATRYRTDREPVAATVVL